MSQQETIDVIELCEEFMKKIEGFCGTDPLNWKMCNFVLHFPVEQAHALAVWAHTAYALLKREHSLPKIADMLDSDSAFDRTEHARYVRFLAEERAALLRGEKTPARLKYEGQS